MIPPPNSLLRSLLRSLLLPSILAIFVGAAVSYLTVTNEYDELLDHSLTGKANLLRALVEGRPAQDHTATSPRNSALLDFEIATRQPNERTVFWFFDADGTILEQSPLAANVPFPKDLSPGLSTLAEYRFVRLESGDAGQYGLIVGEPLNERNRAIRDIVIGVLISFLALVMIIYFATYRSLQRSVGTIAKLSENIAEKNEHDLRPIDRRNSFAEIEPAVDTLDQLMARLETAIAAEREFATVAAHELRTPVAICLAHVQRLKATLQSPGAEERVVAVEQGLKRLTRLIERLLQLSRTQSGLGTSADKSDINLVVRLLLSELRTREPSEQKLRIREPRGALESYVTPDALGIILNNLFDNALKYCEGEAGIVVDASRPGEISISNDCEPLGDEEIVEVKRRFGRKSNLADGYGLGLSIVQALCEQSGCRLDIGSPTEGRRRGFTATLKIP